MKKTFALLTLFLLLLQFTGCSQPALPPEANTSSNTVPAAVTETVAPSATTTEPLEAAPPQAPLITVSLPTYTESVAAEDGTEIFKYTFQNISLITQDADVADLVIIDFLNRIDATRLTADRIHAQAKSTYANQSNWEPYLCMISYAPMRIDAGVLSLFGTQAGFYGSTHPETVYSAVNYDLVTGLPLTLGDILPDSASTDTLLDAVLAVLKSREKELYLYEDYADTVKDHFSGSSLQSSWYFTDQGLCFYFTPYEIAPYSAGVVTAVIPYDMLAGVISDAYFPAELDTASGSVFAQSFLQSDLARFDRFSEIVQDAEGENILLYTDHVVRNVRIETGFWSATGTFFTPEHTVFAASALSAGDAVMVQAVLSEELPQLQLTYENDEGKTTVFISKDSGGNILLKTK